MKLVFILPDAS